MILDKLKYFGMPVAGSNLHTIYILWPKFRVLDVSERKIDRNECVVILQSSFHFRIHLIYFHSSIFRKPVAFDGFAQLSSVAR